MNKDIVRGIKNEKMLHIGHRVKIYRECKQLPIKLFAERCGIAVIDAMDVETGMCVKMDTAMLLKIAEVLGVTYADLFEMDDGRYYSNIDSPAVVDYIFNKARNMNISVAYIGKTLEVPKSTFHNWTEKKRVSSPFDMMNIMSLLKIDADELRAALRTVPVVIETPTTEKTEKEAVEPESIQMLNEITKAIEVYRNVGTLLKQLDEIIEKAQEMKIALGGK